MSHLSNEGRDRADRQDRADRLDRADRPDGTDRPGRHDRHDRYAALACGWALDALEPEDEARLAPHVAGCPRCTRTIIDTTEIMADLALALPATPPPPALRTRLLAAVWAESPPQPRHPAR